MPLYFGCSDLYILYDGFLTVINWLTDWQTPGWTLTWTDCDLSFFFFFLPSSCHQLMGPCGVFTVAFSGTAYTFSYRSDQLQSLAPPARWISRWWESPLSKSWRVTASLSRQYRPGGASGFIPFKATSCVQTSGTEVSLPFSEISQWVKVQTNLKHKGPASARRSQIIIRDKMEKDYEHQCICTSQDTD